MSAHPSAETVSALPPPFAGWFAARGWQPHAHQIAMIAAADRRTDALLVAPTGGGKTLAGFLPSLIELAAHPRPGLHTLYVSPLKALAVDVHRNLARPIAEMDLPVSHETRTGDTPQNRRARQRRDPPNILMTTPESLALLLATPDAGRLFAGLSAVIVDELHAMAASKRGDLLALDLARLKAVAPGVRLCGLSATVADPPDLARFLSPGAVVVTGAAGAPMQADILAVSAHTPWSGHSARYAMPAVMALIRAHRTAIVFTNTRAQAEIVFAQLWQDNDAALPIALHHGSLDRTRRRKVEAEMAAGRLRAVVATSSLDLGLDWGAVDIVIQIGAPKGAARLIQRIGRANHQLDAPSRAVLVPGNRFEALECWAAVAAVRDFALDPTPKRRGGLDVLAQHIMGVACAGPFHPDDLYAEVRRTRPYAELTRADFDAVLGLVETGGYALKGYTRYRRLTRLADGRFRLAHPRLARLYRMNVGTIVEAPLLKVKTGRGRPLGEVEEYFVLGLNPGDTFLFAGQVLRFEGVREMTVIASPAAGDDPKIPAYMGGRLPISAMLADRVMAMLHTGAGRAAFGPAMAEWLDLQARRSELPAPDTLLVETFPRAGRHYLVAYGFGGHNAHQTLGMLLTKRMQKAGLRPLGFVANDYALACWSMQPAETVESLFDVDILGDDLEEWIADSPMLKRLFRNAAAISVLIPRHYEGQEKTVRQMTVNADLVYDVLRKYEPDHVLLRAARQDANEELIDLARLTDLLLKVQGRIRHRRLTRVSPFAVPLMLEIGKENMAVLSRDELLDEAAEALIAEAGTDAADTGEEEAGQAWAGEA